MMGLCFFVYADQSITVHMGRSVVLHQLYIKFMKLTKCLLWVFTEYFT